MIDDERSKKYFQSIPSEFSGLDCLLNSVNLKPLLQALSNDQAVAFIGAGPSIDSGLPSWKDLLSKCLAHAKSLSAIRSNSWRIAERCFELGDYLMVAELLQRGFGTEVERFLWDEFEQGFQPSTIHRALAKMPFSLFLTTNYDRLLEQAMDKPPFICTWKDPDGFFASLKNRRRAIVKIHGDVGKPNTLILTRSSYRDVMHKADQFNECLKSILTFKTVLFVGTSLRDPDLLHLIDVARLTLKSDFGPHYALLFSDEVDEVFVSYLRDAYCIEAIVLQPCKEDTFRTGERSALITKVLVELAGRSNLDRTSNISFVNLNDPLLNLKSSCDSILRKAIKLSGSIRGDICMIADEHTRAIKRLSHWPPDKYSYVRRSNVEIESETVPPDSLIGAVYNRKVTKDLPTRFGLGLSVDPLEGIGRHCTYIEDVSLYASSAIPHRFKRRQPGLEYAKYRECYSEIKSELLCPIYSNEQIVGVINVESDLANSYTPFHGETLERVAEQLGGLYNEVRHRQIATSNMRSLFRNVGDFQTQINNTRLLKNFDLRFILWEPDYCFGKIIAHSKSERKSVNYAACELADFILNFIFKHKIEPTGLFRPVLNEEILELLQLKDDKALVKAIAQRLERSTQMHANLLTQFGRDLLNRLNELKLVVQWDSPFTYNFSDLSLATRILRSKERVLIEDSTVERNRAGGVLAKEGCEEFNIHGPIMATPLQLAGETGAVLVSWSGLSRVEIDRVLDEYHVSLADVDERIYRASHLVVSDPSIRESLRWDRAIEFLGQLNDAVGSLQFEGAKEGKTYPIELIKYSQEFRDKAACSLLRALTHPSCNLPRTRLWIRFGQPARNGFVIWHSYTTPRYTAVGKESQDAYVGARVSEDDPYLKHSLARYKFDPYTRTIHESMFGVDDINCNLLDKTKGRPWFVGLIAGQKMWGFISADDHLPESIDQQGNISLEEDPEKAFQRRCIDLVTHYLRPIVFAQVTQGFRK